MCWIHSKDSKCRHSVTIDCSDERYLWFCYINDLMIAMCAVKSYISIMWRQYCLDYTMNLHKQTILNNSKHKYKNTWTSSSPTSLQAVNIHPEMHVFGLF